MERETLLNLARSGKYAVDAYLFVQAGLNYTVRKIHPPHDPRKPSEPHHITGQQLCHGLRDYAQEQYGLMARTVLRHWGVTTSEDFGHIVFALVEAGIMAKTDEDRLEDFVGVFNFAEAFGKQLILRDRKRPVQVRRADAV